MFKRFNNYPPQNSDVSFTEEAAFALQEANPFEDMGHARLYQMGYDAASLLMGHLADNSIHNVLGVCDALLLANHIDTVKHSVFHDGTNQAIANRTDIRRGALI